MKFINDLKKLIINLNSTTLIYLLKSVFTILRSIHRNIKLIIILGIIIFILNLIYYYLEEQVENKIGLEKWHNLNNQKIQEKSNVHFNSQGIYLDFLKGIVLKGVRIQDEEQSYRFTSEDVVLNISLYSLMFGEIKFNSIDFIDSKLQISEFNIKILEKINNQFYEVFKIITETDVNSSFNNVINHENIFLPVKIKIINLNLLTLKNENNTFENNINLNCELFINSKISKDTGRNCNIKNSSDEVSWNIELFQETENKIKFNLNKVPSNYLVNLIYFFNFYNNKDTENYLTLDKGKFTGTGTYELVLQKDYISKNENYILNENKINFKINFNDFNFDFNHPLFPSLINRNSNGWMNFDIHQYIYKSKIDITSLNKNKKNIQPIIITDFNYKIYQKSLQLHFIKKTNFKNNLVKNTTPVIIENIEYNVISNLNSTIITDSMLKKNKANLTEFLSSEGKIIANLKILDDGKDLSFSGKLISDDLDWTNYYKLYDFLKEKYNEINCKHLELVKDNYKSDLKIKMQGTAVGSNYELNGGGDFKFTKEKNDSILNTKLMINLDISKIELEPLIKIFKNTKEHILKVGLVPSTRKYLGTEQGQFYKSKFYKSILAGLKIKGKVNLKNINALYPIPNDLNFSLNTDGYKLELKLLPQINIKNKNDFRSDFNYSMNYVEIIPRHQLSLSLDMNQNLNPFSTITNTQKAPEKIKLEYKYSGFGILPSDILRNSYSYLNINSNNILIKDEDLSKSISSNKVKGNELISDTNLFENLSFRRTTNGIDVKLTFNGLTKEQKIEGIGEYSFGLGGMFNYTVNKLDKNISSYSRKSNTKLRILASGKWVLELN